MADSLLGRARIWINRRYRDQLTRKLGGTQVCPWCRQCAQFGDGQHYTTWERDPFLDVMHCGVCEGTSLWRWEIGMIYIGPLDPPLPMHTPYAGYDIAAARLKGASETAVSETPPGLAEYREDFDLAHGLIQEAKGFAGPGSITDHLDAAEGCLDRIEARLSTPPRIEKEGE